MKNKKHNRQTYRHYKRYKPQTSNNNKFYEYSGFPRTAKEYIEYFHNPKYDHIHPKQCIDSNCGHICVEPYFVRTQIGMMALCPKCRKAILTPITARKIY